ncbi:MAG: hypothetical protein ABIJ72_00065 [bacterium]
MTNKNKKEITLENLSAQIELLAKGTDSKIDALAKNTNSQIASLAEMINFGFNTSEKRFQGIDSRFDKLEKEITFVKNTLEKHTTILKRLDEERIFTLNYVKRLENEIEKIKVHLKIA